jgi:hypothetical protein
MRILLAAVAAIAIASPAMAQTPPAAGKETRAAKQLTGPDMNAIKEGANTLKLGGECMATFTVTVDGKTKDLKTDCNPPEYAPYVEKAMATVTYSPELYRGEVFETEGVKQPFKFGNGPGTSMAASANKPATVVTNANSQVIARAINKIKKEGECKVMYVVGVDGKTKDIQPNCTPSDYDEVVAEVISQMVYSPATNDNKPIESKMQMNIPLKKQ